MQHDAARNNTNWFRLPLALTLLLTVLVAGSAPQQAAAGGNELGFNKVFAPDIIGPGSTSTLTFTIDNSTHPTGADAMAFTDILPAGMAIASPAAVVNGCNGTVSAPDGGGTITLSGGKVAKNASCTISVNVTSSTPGVHMNTSSVLAGADGAFGPTASDDLEVDALLPGFTKSFSPATIQLGGTSTLTLIIDNTGGPAQPSLSANDVLPANMLFATPNNLSSTCASITPFISGDAGNPTLSATGSIGAGATCAVSVDVTTLDYGSFTNTTSGLDVDGSSSGFAVAVLEVPVVPLAKVFTDDPVAPGGTAQLQFRISNLDRSFALTGLAFTDPLPAGLTLVGDSSDPCGAGSTVTGDGTDTITFAGGSVAAGAWCVFTVDVLVGAAVTAGDYVNTTSGLTGFLDGSPYAAPSASDVLTVSTAPTLTKVFTDDPVGAGGSATLEFTITNNDPTNSITLIEFTDDLETTIAGLAANGLVVAGVPDPLVDPCGAGSELTVFDPFGPSDPPPDPTQLIFTGGSLAAGVSCTFPILVDVPVGVPSGTYTNTTSELTADNCGECPITGAPASGDLVVVGGATLTKDFTDDPAVPGGTVTLDFTLQHPDAAPLPGDPAVPDVTGISFSDNLDATLTDLVATGLPIPACGGTLATANSGATIDFTGGSLVAGETCTISVALTIPAGVGSLGVHPNTTTPVTSVVDGVTTVSAAASDDLTVAALTLTKEFTNDPVAPGENVDLTFTLTNNVMPDATGIEFDDDLTAVLAGLTVVGGMGSAVCDPDGAGPVPGTGTLTAGAGNTSFSLAGAELAGGESCSFSVTLNVPFGADAGTYFNTTSNFQASIALGTPVAQPNATDDLIVEVPLPPVLTKEFIDDPVAPGEQVTLLFEITNPNVGEDLVNIAFHDDLDATLTGLAVAAAPAPVNNCSGMNTSLSPGFFDYSGGSLLAGESCTITLTLDVPGGAPFGIFPNTTSAITADLLSVPVVNGVLAALVPMADLIGVSASDDLQVFQPPTFAKAFAPAQIVSGAPSTLTFTIDNSASSFGASSLEFTDVLPAGVVVADPPNTSKTCAGGMAAATAGSGTFFYGGGLLAGGASCTVQVDVTSSVEGAHVNTTGDLTSSSGNSGTATATLTVDDAPTVTINQAAAQADPTNTQPINFTVVFNEAVTGFATGDVTLGGTAGVAGATAAVTGSGTTYNVAVSGVTTDGTVIATIAAGVATDTGGNSNAASTSTDNTVTLDTTAPTVTINQAAAQADPTNTQPINFTVVFNEAVTGFATGDVTLGGTAGVAGATAAVTGSGTTYNVAVSGVTTDGTVIATIAAGVATDTGGNSNAASTSTDNTVTLATPAPTVTINQAAAQADPTDAQPINFTVVFNEAVTGFATGDVTLGGTAGVAGATAAVTGSGTTYNVAVSGVTSDGTVIASIAAGVAVNTQGNGNVASTSTDNSVTLDTTPPVINAGPITVNNDPGKAGANVDYTVTASDALGAASQSASVIAPGAVTCTPASGSFFPIGTTTVNCTATDTAGNTSTASFQVVVIDNEKPVITNPGTLVAPIAGPVTFPLPAATDNSGTVTVTCVPASGSIFPVGPTPVTCTATDPAGNTATTTFNVDVQPIVLPKTGGGLDIMTTALQVLLAGAVILGLSRIGRRRRLGTT